MKRKPIKEYPPILVLPLDSEKQSIEDAKTAGYVVVLSNNPEAVTFMTPQISTHHLFMAALNSLCKKDYIADAREAFVFELRDRLEAQEALRTVLPDETNTADNDIR